MAYDPKSYLEQALQQGFESVYSQPSSLETGEAPQYQGDVATFGDVQVRPMTIGGTEDAPEYGHMVSVPLTGQYQGYFRNDIYDSQGNFVKTTISEPADSGFKDLAQIGLMALSGGILGPTGQLFSKGIGALGALQSGDPLRILGAAAGMPGAGNYIPAELKTIADYAGKAGQVASALKGNPSAIFSLISGADKSGALSGKTASAGYGGTDPGYFDPDAETRPLPAWALDPYGSQSTFLPVSEIIRERQGLEDRYPAPQGQVGQETSLKTSVPPQDMARFLEANITDPGTIETILQEYYPELYRQSYSVTGTKEDTGYTPRSIRDIGNVTQVQPGEKLEGADIVEPDLSKNLPKVPGGGAKAKTPSKQDPYKQVMDTLALMQGRRPEEEEYELFNAKPFGYELMYGLRG